MNLDLEDNVLYIPDCPPPDRCSRRRTAIILISLAAMAGGLLAFLYPAAQAAREAARRSQCLCNLCAFSLALHNYHASNDCLPPAFGVDDDGRPRCSWRVSILPYMEQSNLFNSYNFQIPWDAPANLEMAKRMPASFHCPSRDESKRLKGFTSYVAIRGPRTVFPGSGLVKFDDVTDGLGKTLAIVEVDSIDIPWTAPIDLDIRSMSMILNDPKRFGPSSRHPGGINCVLMDGGKIFLPNGITPEQLWGMLTIDGGEDVDPRTAGR